MKTFRIHYSLIFDQDEFPHIAQIESKTEEQATITLKSLVKKSNHIQPILIIKKIEIL